MGFGPAVGASLSPSGQSPPDVYFPPLLGYSKKTNPNFISCSFAGEIPVFHAPCGGGEHKKESGENKTEYRGSHMKKTISLLLAFALSLALAVPALAYDEAAETQRANELYTAGLFNGYGNDVNGNPVLA